MAALFDNAGVIRRAILALLLVNETLVLLGVVRYPTVLGEGGIAGIIADTVILGVYGFLALGSPLAAGRAPAPLVRTGLLLGLCGGIALSVDLVAGYLIAHDATTNANTSLLAYGLFLMLVLLAGGWGAARTGRFGAGVITALWSVIAALLVWMCVEFATYYLFSSTASGAAFIRLEMAADFARSGSTDYAGFVMADLYGAGFFHPVLALILGLLLGSVGAAGGLLAAGRARVPAQR